MEFNYYIDTKVSVWIRQIISIDADSVKTADQLAIQTHVALNTPPFQIPVGVGVLEAGIILPEQQELISLHHNSGNPTLEIIRAEPIPDRDDDTDQIRIYDNIHGTNQPID